MKKEFVLKVAAVAVCFVLAAAVSYPRISEILTFAQGQDEYDPNALIDTDGLLGEDEMGQDNADNEVKQTEDNTNDTSGTGEDNQNNNEENNDPTIPPVETSPIENEKSENENMQEVQDENQAIIDDSLIDTEIDIIPVEPHEDQKPAENQPVIERPDIALPAPENQGNTGEQPIVEAPIGDGSNIENPQEGIGSEAALADTFDIKELQAAVKADYETVFKSLSTFNSDMLEKMLNEITELIVQKKLYTDASEAALLARCQKTRGYAMSLVRQAYKTLYAEKYSSLGSDPMSLGTTSKANSDTSGYQGYQSSGSGSNKSLAEGYINTMTKEVKSETVKIAGEDVNKFREYQVSVGFDLPQTPDAKQVKNTDIILLIDNSSSMSSNIDSAKENARYIIDSIFPATYNKSDSNGANIGVVAFNTSSAVMTNLTNNRSALVAAVNRISASSASDTGVSGTNMQGALLKARDMLGIKDGGAVSGGRSKIIILISDGVPTARTSDIWNYGKDNIPFVGSTIGYPSSSSSSAEYGKKRWSYLQSFSWKGKRPDAELIVLPDRSTKIAALEETANDSKYVKQQDFTKRITKMEANHIVSQGIELYTVSYGDTAEANSLMSGMTAKLTDTPNLKLSTATGNPMETYKTSSISGRSYNAGNVKKLTSNILAAKAETTTSSFEGFKVTETLHPDFEFANAGKISVTKTPFGTDGVSKEWKNFSVSGQTLTWTTPSKISAEGTYYLNYTVKVKDTASYSNGADKTLYGAKAADKVSFSKGSTVEYKEILGASKKLNFTDLKVSIQPNLQIEFNGSSNTVLLGEEFEGTPKIVTGAGYYDYTITQIKAPGNNKKVELDKKTDFKAPKAYDLEFDKIVLSGENPGDYEYQLEVKDLVSKQTQKAVMKVAAREQSLTVNIVDESGGTSLVGAFESKLKATNAENKNEEYYLVGLGKRLFKYSEGNTFLKRGTSVSAETYVPYGYEVVSVQDTDGAQDGKVTIDIKESGGSYTGFEQSITVKVRKKTNPMFFYDWSWIIENKKGSI